MRHMFENTLFSIASIVVTAGLVAASSSAIASTGVDPSIRQTRVEIADLAIDTAAGRATAERRIRAASAQVCDAATDATAQATCRNAAMDQAIRALDTRTVTTADAAR